MTTLVDDVIAFCRMFSSFEREEICCGTVSPAQCVLLQTLLDGEWDVSGLAAYTRVTKGAMTRLVDGLEARGDTALLDYARQFDKANLDITWIKDKMLFI